MEKIFDLEKFGGGALAEQLNTEMQKVLNNIDDPNTAPEKVRKVSLSISLKPNKKRNIASVSIQTKVTLSPVIPFETSIMIEKDLKNGKVMASEVKNSIDGQVEMDIEEKKSNDSNVIDLKKTNNK